MILASNSPRRKELFSKYISKDFITYSPKINESESFLKYDPINGVKDVSKRKNLEARNHFSKEEIIITADTIVLLDNEVLGKPKDEKDAFDMLKKLSNKSHFVITAYTISKGEQILTNYVKSIVTFNDLSDELIKKYVDSKSPLDKAGGYGIQDNTKFPIINKLIGSYDNVVGFPILEIKEDLKRFL